MKATVTKKFFDPFLKRRVNVNEEIEIEKELVLAYLPYVKIHEGNSLEKIKANGELLAKLEIVFPDEPKVEQKELKPKKQKK